MEPTTSTAHSQSRPRTGLNSQKNFNSAFEDFCTQCQALFCGQYGAKGGAHHQTVQSLRNSMLKDCYIYCYLWNSIADKNCFNSTDIIPATEFAVFQGWHSESLNLRFRLPDSKSATFLLFPQRPLLSKHREITSLTHQLTTYPGSNEENHEMTALEISTSIVWIRMRMFAL
jgi:hypothetical protein